MIYLSPFIELSKTSGLNGVPLNHPRIGYKSIVTNDNLTGTAGQAGYPLTNINVDQTFEKYRPSTTGAVINVDAGIGVDVDYVGIVATGMSGNIKVEYSGDDISYSEAIEFTPLANDTLMALFETVTARYFRITFDEVAAVTNIKIGEVLAMPRGIYGGHSPLPLSATTVKKGNVSESGQWLGRTILRKGFSTNYEFNNLKAAWYRENFQPFVEHTEIGAFYISWNPRKFANEVGYCWTNSDIKPVNTGTIDFMSVSLEVRGYDVNAV